jgi:hypothetical protein
VRILLEFLVYAFNAFIKSEMDLPELSSSKAVEAIKFLDALLRSRRVFRNAWISVGQQKRKSEQLETS